jgi:hypothetical protein
MRHYLMSDFAQFLREGRGDVRITKANDVRVLDDAKELFRGEIEKKRGKKRPALRKVRIVITHSLTSQ